MSTLIVTHARRSIAMTRRPGFLRRLWRQFGDARGKRVMYRIAPTRKL